MKKQINDHPLLQMPRLNVQSTNVRSIGYDAEKRTLVVEFNNWSVYSYTPVTEDCFNEFLAAGSKGQFFNEKIRKNTSLTVENIRPKTDPTKPGEDHVENNEE